VSITYYECESLALGTQSEMLVRHIVVCDISYSTVFSTLSRKLHDFRKKIVIEHKKCVF